MYSLFARLYSLQTLFDYCYVLGCDDRLIMFFTCPSINIKNPVKPWFYGTYFYFSVIYLWRSAERQGTEPKHPTAYKSVFYFPIFQIGNETVTIFINAFVRLCPLFVCLSHGFKDTTLFRITQMPEYKRYHVGARCKLYI